MPADKMHLRETITQGNEPLLPQEGSNRRESSLGPSKGRGHEDRGPGKLRATRGGSRSLGWAQDPLREGRRVGTMTVKALNLGLRLCLLLAVSACVLLKQEGRRP